MDTITIEVTDENIKEIARISLTPDNQVRLRIIQLTKEKAKLQDELTVINAELAELRK